MPKLPGLFRRIRSGFALKNMWLGKSKVRVSQDFFGKMCAELHSENKREKRAAVISLVEYGKSKFGAVHAEEIFLLLRPLALKEDRIVRRAALLGIADIAHRLGAKTRKKVKAIISKASRSSDFRIAKTANAALYYFENPPVAGVRKIPRKAKTQKVTKSY